MEKLHWIVDEDGTARCGLQCRLEECAERPEDVTCESCLRAEIDGQDPDL